MNLSKCLTFVFLIVGTALAQEITLKIELDKTHFLTGEPVKAIVSLTNTNIKTIEVIYHFATSDNIEILLLKNEIPQKPAYSYKGNEFIFLKKISLRPGEKLFDLLHISRWFGNSTNDDFKSSCIRELYLTEGNYKVKIKYTISDLPHKISNDYYSNEVEFRVLNPVDETDLNMLRELKLTSDQSRRTESEIELYAEKLMQIIDKYPNSGYRLAAYNNLFGCGNLKKNKNFEQYVLKLLTEYPNSYVTLINTFTLRNSHKELFYSPKFQSKLNKKLFGNFIATFKKLENNLTK